MEPLTDTKLSINGISKAFSLDTAVLETVSFEVRNREFLSILGQSGCGKTTLLRILIGLIKPDKGFIIKDDVDITDFPPAKRKMGIVFQNYALFENMSALENVSYALRIHKETRCGAEEKAKELLAMVGLKTEMQRRPTSLSGGQQQRVAIARTLAMNPDLILFDEPMSALDIDTRLSLRQDLKDLQRQFGTTMIYVTHDQEEAFALSDRIMVLNNGRIEQIDSPQEIIAHPATSFVDRFVRHNIQLKIDSLLPFSSKGQP